MLRKSVTLMWILTIGALSLAKDVTGQDPPDYVEGEIIIHATPSAIPLLNTEIGGEVIQTYNNFPNIFVIKLPGGLSVPEAVESYASRSSVLYVEPNYIHQITQVHPNDPRYTDGTLWGLNNTGQFSATADSDIDAPEGWERENASPGTLVSVIDTGVRYTHEDLADNMWVNPDETPGNGIDDDGNGYVDDIHGIDAIDEDGDPSPGSQFLGGHGTHVGGTVGAVGNNSLGIAGVTWGVQIMACKAFNDSGIGSTADEIECIDYSIDKRVDVINASWGDTFSNSLRECIAFCRNYDITFVAAAGNDGSNPFVNENNDEEPKYPTSFDLDNIISVAATTWDDELAPYSNWGLVTVDLGAPGGTDSQSSPLEDDIFSAWHDSDDSYQYLAGTSMAAPHVTGAVALLKERYPFMSYFHRINRILASADPLAALDGITVTGGRLNIDTMLVSHIDHPSINDNFGNASEIVLPSSGNITAVDNNIDASKESGEPDHAGFSGGRSVWWQWEAQSDMTVTIHTGGSGFSTLLGVYTGSSVSGLTLVDEAEANYNVIWSQVSFQVSEGTTYRIAVDGKGAVEGTIKLTVKEGSPVWPPIFGFDVSLLSRDRANGDFSFEVFGPPSAEVTVEYSLDLDDWTNLHPDPDGTYTLNSSGFLTITDSEAVEEVKYYRASSSDSAFTYSFNTVGYADRDLSGTDNMISQPFENPSFDTVAEVFPNPPADTKIYRWDAANGSWEQNSYHEQLNSWVYPDWPMVPGTGYDLQPGSPFTVTFMGEIPEGYNEAEVDNGTVFLSSIVAEGGELTTDLLFPVVNGDKVDVYENGSFETYTYDNGSWSPSEPVLEVGEPFFSTKNIGFWWRRNFFIWPGPIN